MIPASASKTVEHVSPTKSEDTTWSSVYPTMPLPSSIEARLTSALISSYVVGFSSSHVRSTTDTSTVGTRNAMPVSLPFMTGYAFATALAAPVEDGMMLAEAARPARQSAPFMELSTTAWEAVAACTVVMRPCLMPNFSLITLTSGARPLVVHEAQETTDMEAESYSSVLTPTTMVGVSASLAGAEMMTFFAPPATCFMHASVDRKAPVDSQTYSTPRSPHGISVGSR